MIDEDEIYSLKQEAAAERFYSRGYRSKLLNHPDCRDPDHPGCEECEDED